MMEGLLIVTLCGYLFTSFLLALDRIMESAGYFYDAEYDMWFKEGE